MHDEVFGSFNTAAGVLLLFDSEHVVEQQAHEAHDDARGECAAEAKEHDGDAEDAVDDTGGESGTL